MSGATGTRRVTAAAGQKQPAWIDELNTAYRVRGKRVVILTGCVSDRHWSVQLERYLTLEQVLYHASKKLLVVRFDLAHGIRFIDSNDEREFVDAVGRSPSAQDSQGRPLNLRAKIAETRGSPLTALTLLRECAEAMNVARRMGLEVRPLLILIEWGGAMFPHGEFDRLSELDRMKLVTFLGWAGSPSHVQSHNLIIVVADTKAEINNKLLEIPHAAQVVIDLPDDAERARFVRAWRSERKAKGNKEVKFEGGIEAFIRDTAGMRLATIEEMLSLAAEQGSRLTRDAVLEQLNAALAAELGEIVTVHRPRHTADDVVGQDAPKRRLLETLKRCEDSRTAVSGIIVGGANGVGKTFVVEGVATSAGWLMLKLSGVRDKYFGETDRKFERLAMILRRFRRVIIYVPEARAVLGSVHRQEVHETERRLTGHIYNMMSDKSYRGRVVWILDTARPDEFDPDIQRRCPIQIALFDPEGEERKLFVAELLKRNGLGVSDDDLTKIIEQTARYSASDFGELVVLARGDNRSVLEVLSYWEPPDIEVERRFQALVAMLHCTYRDLIPQSLRDQPRSEVQNLVAEYKAAMGV